MRPRVVVLERIHEAGVERLRAFAEVDVRLGLDRAGILASVVEADAIVVKSAIAVDETLLGRARRLRVIARAGTGTENIDLAAAARRGIAVLAVPTGNTVSAAEFTVALILDLCRRIPAARTAVAAGDFRRHLFEGRELAALAVGLVGVGNVGIEVARRLAPFGCRLLGYDPESRHRAAFAALGGEMLDSFHHLLSASDVVSFHVRHTPETLRMLDAAALARIKPGSMIVNTARGAVIDAQALLRALGEGRVAGAAIDVLDPDPPFEAAPGEAAYDHPLLHHERVLVTPHMAASTVDAQRRIAVELAERMADLLG